MPHSGFREEVLNIVLAQVLTEQGVVAAPERLMKWKGARHMPDVVVVFQGLRTVLEGKIDDHPGAADQVLKDVQGRVEQGIAHIGIAVLYPAKLRDIDSLASLRKQMTVADLSLSVSTEAGTQDWTLGTLDTLASLLRRTFDELVEEDVVAKAAAALDAGVEAFARAAITATPAAIDRCAAALGISLGDVENGGPDES